jgi:hypothetical protein
VLNTNKNKETKRRCETYRFPLTNIPENQEEVQSTLTEMVNKAKSFILKFLGKEG